VTREEFETLCADLFDKVKKPIEDAIKSSEVMHDELTTVILVGGSTRIPKVQDELLKATKKKELGKNLNTDEAPALGAVYQCAYQSKGYKVKKFHIKDVNAYPIVVDFERFLEENDAAASSSNNKIRRVLFDRLNPFPQKKVMTFSKHTKNFDFSVNYGDLSFYDDYIVKSIGSLNISQVSLSNVEDIFKKHGTDDSKGIKVHFKLDDSGILHLDKIDVSFEKITEPEESTLSKIGNTISSFFGSSTDEEKKVESEQQQQETTTQSSTTKEPEAGKKEEGTNSTDKTTEEKLNATANANLNDTALNATKTVNLTVLREEVKFESVQIDLKPIEKQLYDESVSKLQAIKEKEKEKRKRAMAFNSLETFIFDTRDKLNQEEFIKCSTEKEREAIGAKLDEVDAWLSEADDTVETKMFQEKLTELKNVSRDVFYRLSERRLRPKKLDELKDVLNRSSSFLGTLTNYTGEDLPLTEVERSTLEKLINTTKVRLFFIQYSIILKIQNLSTYIKKRNGELRC
jgi:hypoxia up-regulated 1